MVYPKFGNSYRKKINFKIFFLNLHFTNFFKYFLCFCVIHNIEIIVVIVYIYIPITIQHPFTALSVLHLPDGGFFLSYKSCMYLLPIKGGIMDHYIYLKKNLNIHMQKHFTLLSISNPFALLSIRVLMYIFLSFH